MKVVNCECGELVQAGTEDEIVTMVEQHVVEKHPDLVGKIARSDIVAMAEEV